MKKFQTDFLFDGKKIDANKAIVINSQGVIKDIFTPEEKLEGFEQVRGMITPSFINSHCHLELSHLKGTIPRQSGMVAFMQDIVRKRNALCDEQKLTFFQKALDESYNTGTFFIADICNTDETVEVKKRNSKIRYHNFIEVIGYSVENVVKRFDKICKAFRSKKLIATLTPHSNYMVSFEVMKDYILKQEKKILSTHNQESEEEHQLFTNNYGSLYDFLVKMNVISNNHNFINHRLKPFSFLEHYQSHQKILFVHNVFTTTQDIQLLLNSNISAFFCFCPRANLFINNVLPDIDKFYRIKDKVVFGTDSLASNDDLNIFEELKLVEKHTKYFSTTDLLKSITVNPLQLFDINDECSFIQKGNKCQLVALENYNEEKNNPQPLNRVKYLRRLF